MNESGSKTAQLIEQMHGTTENPTGCIIANDSDYKRAKLLVHQSQRMNSPSILVTNHPAQAFPTPRTRNGNQKKFNRILCDVPCSGKYLLEFVCF